MQMNQTLDQVIALMKLSNQFSLVQRAIYKIDTERMENDAEHSYQLAFLGWQLNDMLKLWLDSNRIMQYALAHDLVEIYAWDTDAMWTAWDPATKVQREHEAFLRLQNEYSSFASFIEALEKYEARSDEESRFVYALDKLLPTINIYLNWWRDWKRKGVTLADTKAYKDKKVAEHPEIEKLYNELNQRLEENYDMYFDK
jgi:5'-deoxynucleotidase YfbR-like HD superfamily hydrolase